MKKQTPPRTIRGIDDETWRKFKAACAIEGVLMGQKLTELVINFIKKFPEVSKWPLP